MPIVVVLVPQPSQAISDLGFCADISCTPKLLFQRWNSLHRPGFGDDLNVAGVDVARLSSPMEVASWSDWLGAASPFCADNAAGLSTAASATTKRMSSL